MELILDSYDLKPKHRSLPTSETKYHHFKRKVRRAIKAVGRAQLRQRDNYNAIYPPKVQLPKGLIDSGPLPFGADEYGVC